MTVAAQHVRHEWPAPNRRYELLDTSGPGIRRHYRPLGGAAHVIVLRGTADVTSGGRAVSLATGQRADITETEDLTVSIESGLVELYLPAEAVTVDD